MNKKYSFYLCHRMPERTFKIIKWYFPVCSRCTGIYIGSLSYLLYVYFNYVEYTLLIWILAILMILPTFIDGITQFFGLRESNNALRFTTGFIGGIGVVMLAKALKWTFIS